MKPLSQKDKEWLRDLDSAMADAVLHARGYSDNEIAEIFREVL